MKISDTVFRFRRWFLIAVVLIGFWAPWERMGGAHPVSTWLSLAMLLARLGVLPVGYSVIAVMGVAILLALAAALLRTWGAAYLGRSVVRDSALHGERVVADGPYRYLRNPLYVGTWLNALALSILMPPGGALFAVIGVAALTGVLVHAEERHLRATGGEAYAAYAKQVPRVFCAFVPRVPAGGAQPHWGDAFLGEIYFWGVVVTYLAFAGRYDATILEQGILISLGLAYIVSGVVRPRAVATE